MRTDSGDQRANISDTHEQRRFDDFLQQIKERQKYIGMKLFDKYFSYRTSDEMLQDLCDSKSKVDNHDKLVLIYCNFDYIVERAENGENTD